MKLEEERILGTLLVVVACILSVFFNCLSIWIVRNNNKISNVIRMYFVCDNIARVINALISLFYTTPCAFTFFCAYKGPKSEGSIAFESNRVAGYIRVTLLYTAHFLTLALAINRFLAVFRDGQWYNYATKGMVVQGVVLMGTPFLVTVPLLIYGQFCMYNPMFYGWFHGGEYGVFIIEHVWNLTSMTILTVVICLDCSAAWLIRKRMGAQKNSTNVKKVDVQIMKQVFSNHLVSLIYYIINRMFDYPEFRPQTPFKGYLFYDLMLPIIDVYNGLTRAYLLRPPKKTEKNQTNSNRIFTNSSKETVTARSLN